MRLHDKCFYSVKEFAKLLNVHTNTIRNAIKIGRIGAFRIGTGKRAIYRIPYSEFERVTLIDFTNIKRK